MNREIVAVIVGDFDRHFLCDLKCLVSVPHLIHSHFIKASNFTDDYDMKSEGNDDKKDEEHEEHEEKYRLNAAERALMGGFIKYIRSKQMDVQF